MLSRRSAGVLRRAAHRRVTALGTALVLLLLGAAPASAASAGTTTPGTATTARPGGEQPAAAQQAVLRGGDRIYAPGAVCTLGFNATDGTQDYGIASGRCLSSATTWYADAAMTVPAGTTADTSFPGDDYGLLHYTNPDVARPGQISAGGSIIDITGSASPMVGAVVCHAGHTTGMHCGTILSVNLTVNYPEGSVHGLFSSNVSAGAGDTGVPAFSGTTALGFVTGASGGSTFYQPVTEVLAAYGLTLL